MCDKVFVEFHSLNSFLLFLHTFVRYPGRGNIHIAAEQVESYHLTHPKHEISKTYVAEVVGRPTDEEMRMFMKGLIIEGKKTYPAKIRILKETKKNSIVEIVIHEGRNRQVRKMCEEIGHKVITLHRQAIGRITIDGVREGSYRFLKDKEIEELKK